MVHENLLCASRLDRVRIERHDACLSRLEGRGLVLGWHLEDMSLMLAAER